MYFIQLILTCVALFNISCASYSYHHNSQNTYASKAEDCDFQVLSTMNNLQGYEEIGVINFTTMASGDLLWVKDASVFKEKIRKFVCSAGGDAVLGEVNGAGGYIRGIVFRKKDAVKVIMNDSQTSK